MRHLTILHLPASIDLTLSKNRVILTVKNRTTEPGRPIGTYLAAPKLLRKRKKNRTIHLGLEKLECYKMRHLLFRNRIRCSWKLGHKKSDFDPEQISRLFSQGFLGLPNITQMRTLERIAINKVTQHACER